jgi:hypothetical protein
LRGPDIAFELMPPFWWAARVGASVVTGNLGISARALDDQAISALIKQLRAGAPGKCRRLAVALPLQQSMLRRVAKPEQLKPAQAADFIRAQLLPKNRPPSDFVMDWTMTPLGLVGAACPRALSEAIEAAAQANGFHVLSVELSPLLLLRAVAGDGRQVIFVMHLVGDDVIFAIGSGSEFYLARQIVWPAHSQDALALEVEQTLHHYNRDGGPTVQGFLVSAPTEQRDAVLSNLRRGGLDMPLFAASVHPSWRAHDEITDALLARGALLEPQGYVPQQRPMLSVPFKRPERRRPGGPS